ncbi:hypothetical protein KCV07_g10065, partial [Aureobasidium melanogenum]
MSDSIEYAGLLDPTEMIPQTDNADCTPGGLGNNADGDLGNRFNTSTEVTSSGRSPQSWCTGGGPDVTDFEARQVAPLLCSRPGPINRSPGLQTTWPQPEARAL